MELQPTDLRALENESLLMLYEAGELAAGDRVEVEALLTTDAAMRRQLDELRSVQQAAIGWLDAAEAGGEAHPRSERIVSDIGAIMRQWNVRRMAKPAVVRPTPSRIGWWAWSGGGLVAAMLAFCIWWGFSGNDARSGGAGDSSGSQTVASSGGVPSPNGGTTPAEPPSDSPSPSPSALAIATPPVNSSSDATSSDAPAAESGSTRSEDVFLAMDGSSQRLAQLEQDVHDDPRVQD